MDKFWASPSTLLRGIYPNGVQKWGTGTNPITQGLKGSKRSGSRKGLFLGGLSEKTNKNFQKKSDERVIFKSWPLLGVKKNFFK